MWACAALHSLRASNPLAVQAVAARHACAFTSSTIDADEVLVDDLVLLCGRPKGVSRHKYVVMQTSGYFSNATSPIGRLQQPISFNLLLGEGGWRAKQQEVYKKLERSWLTPVELFQPWYAQAIANFIIRHHTKRRPAHPLAIVEIGGGQGTLAKGVLACILQDYLLEKHPRIYGDTTYTAIDASPHLVEVQEKRLKKHAKAFQAVVGDARDRQVWRKCRQVYTYVLAMEVLDNLPHDCVTRDGPGGAWQEAVVRGAACGSPALAQRPLQDPLIEQALHAADWGRPARGGSGTGGGTSMWSRMLDAVAGIGGGSGAAAGGGDSDTVYLPTGSLQLFHALHATLPEHQLIAADFAYFTQSEAHGRSVDYDSLLQPPGSADVFFPTDFEAARRLWHTAAGPGAGGVRGTSVAPSPAFLNVYADTRKTKTLTAYNPLVDDFANTSFLLAEAAAR